MQIGSVASSSYVSLGTAGSPSVPVKSHARGRVFKRGKLIGREISAVSKFSSVSDKNRGGAAVMPCEQSP
jgi:hypothetical protein